MSDWENEGPPVEPIIRPLNKTIVSLSKKVVFTQNNEAV